MKVSQIGEFGLIDVLSNLIAKSRDEKTQAKRELIIDIGDDAMVWKPSVPYQIATVDSLVENIHFTLETTTWHDLGWKSLAVNLSDIGAMGGVPLYALISLGLPPDTLVENVVAIYEGMLDIAGRYGMALAGGDTVSSPVIFISVTVIGCASNNRGVVLKRSAAKPGDVVAVTGSLGASAAGLRMFQQGLNLPRKVAGELRKAHQTPVPRVNEGQVLVAGGIKAGMDISDGLVGDLTHICEMSQVGARLNIELVPVSKAARACFPEAALGLALTGGEDYELLFTAPPQKIERVKKALDCPVTVVGEITEHNKGKVVLADNSGRKVSLKNMGWDHFSPANRR